MDNEFVNALLKHQERFSLNLSEASLLRLNSFYEKVIEHNEILHLVAPTTAEEFAVRHILESLTLLEHLPLNAVFADIGTGAGLPSIPCLLAREDLSGKLIESKEKKSVFLREFVSQSRIDDRAEIINRQFEEVEKPNVSFVTCRALDKFTVKLPKILKWSANCKMLLFGGNNLREELTKRQINFAQKLMPLSEQRFLFIFDN